MSPRPRRIDDHAVIAAAAGLVARDGATAVRLADVAAASGLAAATLVQRFGSREALFDAVAAAYHAAIASAFFSGRPPVPRIGEALTHLCAAGHLRFLIGRPASAPAYSLELRKHIGLCLVEAVARNDMPHCDVAHLARRIQIAYYGAALASLLEGTDPADFYALVIGVLADQL